MKLLTREQVTAITSRHHDCGALADHEWEMRSLLWRAIEALQKWQQVEPLDHGHVETLRAARETYAVLADAQQLGVLKSEGEKR